MECCTEPVLKWLANYPGVEVSLLTQYVAPAHATDALAQVLSEREVMDSTTLARELGLQLIE